MEILPGGPNAQVMAGVALAQRLLPVADGSDFMGSLRNPASWCNVVGLRPSPGRVPRASTCTPYRRGPTR